MELALPYVTANLCAVVLVGYLASTSAGRAKASRLAKRNAAIRARAEKIEKDRLRKREKEQAQAHALEHKERTQVAAKQAEVRALARRKEDQAAKLAAASAGTASGTVTGSSTVIPATPGPRTGDITGAGVLMIVWLHGSNQLGVILFRQRAPMGSVKVYTDPGGFLQGGGREAFDACASRELVEESCGIFRMDVSMISRKYPVRYRDYLGVFIPIKYDQENHLKEAFKRSKNSIDTLNPPVPSWSETDAVEIFQVRDLLAITVNPAATTSTHYSVLTVVRADNTRGRASVSDRVVGLIRAASAAGRLQQLTVDLTSRPGQSTNLTFRENPSGLGPSNHLQYNTTRKNWAWFAV